MPYSEQSVFGVDNREQYRENLVQSNFHARLIHQLDPEILHFPLLDVHFSEFIKR